MKEVVLWCKNTIKVTVAANRVTVNGDRYGQSSVLWSHKRQREQGKIKYEKRN